MALPTLQGALKSGFGETVVACDMPEPCKFLSLDSCQKKFLWTHKEVDFAPHPVFGLVLWVEDAEKFRHALGFGNLILFFWVSKQGPCFTAIEEVGGDKMIVELELACRGDGVAQPDPIQSGYCCHCLGNPDADLCPAGAILAQGSSQLLEAGPCSNCWPFELTSALMLFILLVTILLFSVLTFIPYAVALSKSLFVKPWSSPLPPPVRLILSANFRLWAFHQFIISDLRTYVGTRRTKCNFEAENFAQRVTVMHTFHSCLPSSKKKFYFIFLWWRSLTEQTSEKKKLSLTESFPVAETISFSNVHEYRRFFPRNKKESVDLPRTQGVSILCRLSLQCQIFPLACPVLVCIRAYFGIPITLHCK